MSKNGRKVVGLQQLFGLDLSFGDYPLEVPNGFLVLILTKTLFLSEEGLIME